MPSHSRGRPPLQPIDVGILSAATDRAFPDSKRLNVYRILSAKCRVSVRTVRTAFAGYASRLTQEKLEEALKLPTASLLASLRGIDETVRTLRQQREVLLHRMRHADERRMREIMPVMMSVSSLLKPLIPLLPTSDLTSSTKLVILETLHENLAYHHLAFDSQEVEASIQSMISMALPNALAFRSASELSETDLARLDASIGELWNNSTLPQGDVWKRDTTTPKSGRLDASLHRHAESCFASAAHLDSDTAEYYHWRQYLEIEARARIYAKAGMGDAASQELKRIDLHLESLNLDELMQADYLMIQAMVCAAIGRRKEAISHISNAHFLYAKTLGMDHHLPNAVVLYLKRLDSDNSLCRNTSDSIDFFRASPMKTHWLIDLSALSSENL